MQAFAKVFNSPQVTDTEVVPSHRQELLQDLFVTAPSGARVGEPMSSEQKDVQEREEQEKRCKDVQAFVSEPQALVKMLRYRALMRKFADARMPVLGPVVHPCQWPWTPGANVPWPPSPSGQPPYQPLRLVFQVWYRIYATSYIIASACRTLAVDTTRTIACHNELDLAHGQGTPHKTMSWTLGMTRGRPTRQ